MIAFWKKHIMIVIEFSKVSVGLLFTGNDAKQIFDIKTRQINSVFFFI